MTLIFRKTAYLFFFLYSLGISAQVDTNELPSPSSKINTYKYEKAQLDKAYTYLGSQKDPDAYRIGHKILKKTVYRQSKMYASLILGIYFNDRNLADSALFYGNRSLKLLENKKDSISMLKRSLVYNVIANAYGDKSLLEESKKWHLKGIEIVQKYQAEGQYYNKLHNLGATYIRLKDYDYAIELLESCLTYKKNRQLTFTTYISLASAYSLKDNYELAMSYLKKALGFFENQEGSKSKVIILQNIGVQYHLMEKYDEALKYYNEAYTIGKEKGYHRPTLDAMNNIALVHQDRKNYNEAQKSFLKALTICQNLGYLDKQITIYNNLKEISKSQKNYEKSFFYYEKEIEIRDSIRKLQKEKEINQLEVKFKTLQKEKEIKLLKVENSNRELKLKNQDEAIKNLKLQQEIEKKENENQILAFQNTSEKRENEINLLKKDQELQELNLERQKGIKNTILISFLIILIPIIGLLVIYYQKLQTQSKLNTKEKEINEQKINTLLKEQELEVIKASIAGQDKERKRIAQELHDSIGGNLAAIKLQLNGSGIKDKQGLTNINYQIDETYQQVRNLSHNLIPKKFGQNNFCDVLQEYIHKIGNSSSIKTSLSFYPRKEIDRLNEELQVEIFKIIQELITNTIKHAKASNVELHINISKKNNLSLLFEDNGIGFDPENISYGLGFKNIKSRLEKIHGSLMIDSRKGRGTIINIEITNTTTTNYEI